MQLQCRYAENVTLHLFGNSNIFAS